MGATVVVKLDVKLCEVFLVSRLHFGDEILFAAAFLLGAEHNGRAMSVVSTHVMTIVSTKFLEPHPEVGHQVLNQMPNVNMSIGIRQSGGYENAA